MSVKTTGRLRKEVIVIFFTLYVRTGHSHMAGDYKKLYVCGGMPGAAVASGGSFLPLPGHRDFVCECKAP